MSNSSGNELAINTSFAFMSYGNDARTDAYFSNPSSPAYDPYGFNYAMAGGEWTYHYKIDLGAAKQLNYYVLTQSTTNYATDFVIEGSTNGTTWVNLKTVSGATAGRKEGYLNSTYTYRYVRVKSVAPSSGPNAMGIVEFELYKF
jgi:F5/8 type C domain